MTLIPPQTTLAIFGSLKVGHVMPCLGVARALGVEPQMRPVAPRKIYMSLGPWSPADPRDPALSEPYPDIVIASGRETVPYLRAIKKRSGGRTFTVYLGDPHATRYCFDLICVPEHDRLRGANVMATLTSPHPRNCAELNIVRDNPDPRIANLAAPRIALLLGGPSGNYRFEPADILEITAIAANILTSGASLMISPSRRTPGALMESLRATIQLASKDIASRAFIWDGTGDNPYPSMLALADAFVVTTDSVNMIGECVATGKPVHVYEPSGHAGKFAHFIDGLLQRLIIRPWSGRIEEWDYEPLDSTPSIAREIAERFSVFKAARR